MKKYSIWMFGIVALVLLMFLAPNVMAGYSNTTCIAGYYGDEYPYGYIPACHPEISSLDQYVAIVFVHNTGNNAMVRLAYSTNYGQSFSYQYLNNNDQVKQDYPDVSIYKDTSDDNAVKTVIVWQERPDDESEEWEIKAREWSFRTNTWSTSVLSVSDTSYTENDNDNIYPKVSTCSDDSESYWNIVWQRDWDGYTNRYGIYLRVYIRNSGGEGFNIISTLDYPQSWDDNFRHPATDCIPNEDNEDIYVVYDEFHDEGTPQYIIKIVYGNLDIAGNFDQIGTDNICEAYDQDEILGYPDIAVIGPTSGAGNTVDCVWINHTNDNEIVQYSRSTTGGSTFADPSQISSDGSMELRAVAIDMNESYDPIIPKTQYRCHIIWTTAYDVYYRERTGSDASWNEFGSPQDGATEEEYTEDFVDASTSEISPGAIGVYATWQVDGTAVFIGEA